MKCIKPIFLTLSLCGVLTGCNEQEVKTVDYYSNHMDEAMNVIKECKNDASKQGANCQNAVQARNDKTYKETTSKMDTGLDLEWKKVE